MPFQGPRRPWCSEGKHKGRLRIKAGGLLGHLLRQFPGGASLSVGLSTLAWIWAWICHSSQAYWSLLSVGWGPLESAHPRLGCPSLLSTACFLAAGGSVPLRVAPEEPGSQVAWDFGTQPLLCFHLPSPSQLQLPREEKA